MLFKQNKKQIKNKKSQEICKDKKFLKCVQLINKDHKLEKRV